MRFDFVKSIDINKDKNPDQVIDICKLDELRNLSFTPHLICMFEVLEHTEDPISAVNNLYEILNKGGYLMLSTPFTFHIHDEPYDFFRFTKYGLKSLCKRFNNVDVKARNGWFETILVLFVRLRMEKNILSRLVGNFFVLFYFVLSPITYILQKLIKSDRITTGYFLSARK